MRICDYYKTFNKSKVVIGLGYFDSVHKGHAYLIEKVKDMASRLDAMPAIFTFSNNPFAMFGKMDKNIFSFEERCRRLEHLGIELMITVDADKSFIDTDRDVFLKTFLDNFDVAGFVSGTDYTYGAKASGDASSLKTFAKDNNIACEVVDLLNASGKKIASRDIRKMLLDGQIDAVNSLLSEPYSITGKVKTGRHDGSKIGIPTANIDIDKDIILIKNGVYSTMVEVDGKRYRAVTNVGGHPTFGDNSENIEAFILDFAGDIYGKVITITFYRWLRGVKRFDSVKELHDTIMNDELTTRKEVVL